MRIRVSPTTHPCHAFPVPTVARIASARLHRASSAAYGAGGQAVTEFLKVHAGDDYAVVEIERNEGRFSLILDPEWVEMAQAADQEVIDDLELPRASLLAVVAGWAADWSRASSELTVDLSDDEIPHLRLASLRPSTAGAERNARPH